MPIVLHILYKDARRLWKEIAVSWLLLAWLTRMDSWRSGAAPGSEEGWLNLLLPFVWSYLAASCLLQDPLPGERQFWLTLPTRRITMFSAKLLFVALAIHLPYLISNAVVLAARGFHPVSFLPQLLVKQGVLLLVLTLPALALASVSRNAMQFLLLAIAVAGAAVVVGGNTSFAPVFYPMYVRSFDDTRRTVSLAIPVLVGCVMLWIQYHGRRTPLARGAGLTSVAVAAALYLGLSPTAIASLESAWKPLQPTPNVTLQVSEQPRRPDSDRPTGPGSGVIVSIPISIDGVPQPVNVSQLGLEIVTPTGQRFRTDLTPGPARRGAALLASLSQERTYLFLAMNRDIYNQAARVPVNIVGHLLVEKLQKSDRSAMQGYTRTDIPRLGKCAAIESGGTLTQTNMLRIACESPDEFPANVIELTDTATGRTTPGRLGASITNVAYPQMTWLSPLYRGEFYFRLVYGDASRPGEQWFVPESTLSHFRTEFQTLSGTGKAVVSFELRGVDLSRYARLR